MRFPERVIYDLQKNTAVLIYVFFVQENEQCIFKYFEAHAIIYWDGCVLHDIEYATSVLNLE